MEDWIEGRCPCGSGRRAERCCFEGGFDATPRRNPQSESLWTEAPSMLYRQLEEMRRALRSMVSAKNPLESALDPNVDPRFVAQAEPLPAESRPSWMGRILTRETIAYPGREWSDEQGCELQVKLYALVESFGDYTIRELGQSPESACEFENICREYCDYLLMYYLLTPLEIRPGQQVVRRFLGNYYPRTALDANLDFIYRALNALPAFYAWLARAGFVDRSLVDAIVQECRDWPWYRRRLLEYVELKGRARARWCREFDYKAMPVR